MASTRARAAFARLPSDRAGTPTPHRRAAPQRPNLEALSIALGLHPQHLVAVLHGRTPPEVGEPISDNGTTASSRLDAIDERLTEITDLLHEMNVNLTAVISHTRTGQ